MLTRTGAAALALLACGVARASAPASITISGGVSLGAYEAGLVHYAIEAMRLNPAAATPRIVTGASAGSVNGFMTILQSCGAAVDDPTQSLLWNAWIPLGLDQLHDPKNPQKTSAFSRDAFRKPLDLIVKAWKAGLPETCDAVFGLSVTRLVPRKLEGERLQLPRVEEHFVLRVQGRGAGKPPRLTNYVDPRWSGEQTLLVEEGGEVVFDGLVDALYASTAFPGAFPPQEVRSCVVRAGKNQRIACPAEEAHADLYVDGGVFDNTPVRLATRIAAAGLRVDGSGAARWLDRPDLSVREIPPSLGIAYVSTEARTFPAPTDQPRPDKIETLLGVAAQVGGSFYDTARAKNLVYVQEDSPEVFARLLVPERHLPAASSPFGAFFGFFETELRRFDFALGMYDGRRLADARLPERLALAGKPGEVRHPEDTAGAANAAAAWRPYRCLKAVVDRERSPEAPCAGEDLRDFRIVLQTSIERLWDRCARLGNVDAFDGDRLCRSARGGEPVLAVPYVEPLPGEAWRKRDPENEAGYLMRLLAAHGFHFKDLGLDRDEAEQAPAALRARLLAVGDTISTTQPSAQGLVLSTLVRMAADEVAYVPPRLTAWAVFGRDPEMGVSKGFRVGGVFVHPVRFHAALQFVGLSQVLSSEGGDAAFTLLAGAEYLPSWWSTTRLQPSLLLRGGWMFAVNDDGGFSSCDEPGNDTIGHCSRAAIQGGVSATLLERIRLQITANVYPPTQRGEDTQWSIGPGIGIQWNL